MFWFLSQEVFVFGEAAGCRPYLSLLDNNGRAPPRPKVNLDDPVLLPYSSGTTGLPKGVVLTHRNVVSNMCQCMRSVCDGPTFVDLLKLKIVTFI